LGFPSFQRFFASAHCSALTGKWFHALCAEFRLLASIIGGVLGGLSHSLIDSLISTDFHPFEPLPVKNPLFGPIGPGDLSYGKFLSGRPDRSCASGIMGTAHLAGRPSVK
jgi:membrane-bound metal-dependent hydrolase YbcI (DUF457 family)